MENKILQRVSLIIMVAVIALSGVFVSPWQNAKAVGTPTNKVMYFADTDRPMIYQSTLRDNDLHEYEMYFYTSLMWDDVLIYATNTGESDHDIMYYANETTRIASQGGLAEENANSGTEYMEENSCIVVIELRNYIAEATKIASLFTLLRNEGHRILFLSGQSASSYTVEDDEDFDITEYVDGFAHIYSEREFVNNAVNSMTTINVNETNEGLSPSLICLDSRFIPGYTNNMTMDEAYQVSWFLRVLIDRIAQYLGIDIESEGYEALLANDVIDIRIYVYVGNGTYNLLNTNNSNAASYYTLVKSVVREKNPPHYVFLIAPFEGELAIELYSSISGLQNDQLNTEYVTFYEMPVYIFGELPYSENGLAVLGFESSFDGLAFSNQNQFAFMLNALKVA